MTNVYLQGMKSVRSMAIISLLMIALVFGWSTVGVSEVEHVVDDFHLVRANGPINIFLEHGDVPGVRVRADNDVHEQIIVQVENGELLIDGKSRISGERVLDVYVTYNQIETLVIGGAVLLTSQSPITSERLKLIAHGAAEIKLQLDSKLLDLEMYSAANVLLAGTVDRFQFKVAGVGDLVAYNLESTICQATIDTGDQSPGIARIAVTDTLSATIRGPRHLYYRGEPFIAQSEIPGEGKLIQK